MGINMDTIHESILMNKNETLMILLKINIASYNHEPVLPGKPHYDIWQYSRHGRVPGVWNWVDLNRFAKNRSIDDIRIN